MGEKQKEVRWKEDGEPAPVKKEAAVLTNESLTALAKEVQSKGMILAMLLNIPTTRLVRMRIEATDNNTNDENACCAMLKCWKEMRSSAKDKDKIADLSRGLREAGYLEIADVLEERSKDNIELTSDCFPAA